MFSFLTFCTSNWKQSKIRFKEQLDIIQNTYHMFDNMYLYNENDLGGDYKDVFFKYKERNGFRLWSWKPYLILKNLKQLNNNDYLLYLDGGCTFPMQELHLFKTYIDSYKYVLNDINYIGLTRCNGLPVKYQIRDTILNRFELNNDSYFLEKYHHWQSGIILIKKTSESVHLIEEWYNYYLNYYKTDCDFDRYDKSNQIKGFLTHNCDQAILQCLLYKFKIDVLNIPYMLRLAKRIKK